MVNYMQGGLINEAWENYVRDREMEHHRKIENETKQNVETEKTLYDRIKQYGE